MQVAECTQKQHQRGRHSFWANGYQELGGQMLIPTWITNWEWNAGLWLKLAVLCHPASTPDATFLCALLVHHLKGPQWIKLWLTRHTIATYQPSNHKDFPAIRFPLYAVISLAIPPGSRTTSLKGLFRWLLGMLLDMFGRNAFKMLRPLWLWHSSRFRQTTGASFHISKALRPPKKQCSQTIVHRKLFSRVPKIHN